MAIHRYPLSRVQPPRSIATHRKPSLASGKFGGNWAKIGRPGVVEGAMDGREAPHTPTNGLGVSPGYMRTQANPPRHVYRRPGRHIHLPVPWTRQTSGAAGRQNLGPLSPRGMMRHAKGETHACLRWPWLVRGDPWPSTDTLYHACNLLVPSPHTENPRSQVANLAEIGPKLGAREWSRVRWTAVKPPTPQQMALECPQGTCAHRQTRPGMCTAALADTSTFPCHGQGKLPGRPVAKISGH